MESLVLDYIKQYFPAIASWTFGFVVSIAGTDYIKRARRDFGCARPNNTLVRTYAMFIAAAACHSAGIFFFNAPQNQSIVLSLFCGIACPVFMSWLMRWAKTNKPDLYSSLKVAFPGDGKDPDATGEF